MARVNASSGQGALFELVARGVKDRYFVKDDPESTFVHDPRYSSSVPHLAERRTAVPLNGTAFGTTFEVEIDRYADIMTECALDVTLPSWFPPLPLVKEGMPLDPEVANGLYPITTQDSGVSYGYVNGVGYYLFERIQFYQDQFLIQEWSGDGLLAKQHTEGSRNSRFLALEKGGWRESLVGQGNRGIQMRATPGALRIYLPLPGMQCPGDGGFPLTAMPWQTLRLRISLRHLEDIVVCSDDTIHKPAPWNVPAFQYLLPNGTPHVFAPLGRVQIGAPTVLLSTVQHYVSPEVQEALRTQPLTIPFRRMFENQFSFGELDFISLDKGGASAVTRILEGRHPTERLLWFFRSSNTLRQNRLDDFRNDYFDDHAPTETQPETEPAGRFYYRLKLIIAGKDREDVLKPLVWDQMAVMASSENAPGRFIGVMEWSTGDGFGSVYPIERQPEGSINLSTADRPTLYLELANIRSNPFLAQRKCEMRVYTEGWNVYEVKEGRGRVMFAS